MIWNVRLSAKARRNIIKIPLGVRETFQILLADLEYTGPIKSNWPHFGKISGWNSCYHCHLQKGRPTYVAVWRVVSQSEKLVEVMYVGTHEKARYDRLCRD
ncbi:MAG TPA: cytotoxic translational repressor of toxin-antitoxin stability system [Desulfobacterales bacterium]|nr:cytotoxic translational repressor of toxin-antitoxin stability system [Desulfobacterales bacterium]